MEDFICKVVVILVHAFKTMFVVMIIQVNMICIHSDIITIAFHIKIYTKQKTQVSTKVGFHYNHGSLSVCRLCWTNQIQIQDLLKCMKLYGKISFGE